VHLLGLPIEYIYIYFDWKSKDIYIYYRDVRSHEHQSTRYSCQILTTHFLCILSKKKKNQMADFMEIRPWEAGMVNAGGWTDRQTDTNVEA
jgi:hypothetical protein